MWDTTTEYFKHPEIESYKVFTLEHMNELWGNWRSTLNTNYVKTCKSKLEAVKNVPGCMDSKDWEWLVNNVFYTAKYQEMSARNAENRAKQKKTMTHRCGSKPHREVIYEMGGKEGNPPNVREVFRKTRKVDENTVEPELRRKYDEMVEAAEAEPTLTNLQVVERYFGRQRHGRVFGYGGGLKRKHFESTSEIEELKAKLREKDDTNRKLLDCTFEIEELKAKLSEKDETNRKLMERVDQFENRLLQMENEREERTNANSTSSSNNELRSKR